MPRSAKLSFEILKPMVARGLAPKQIAYELGFSLRMVHRRMKALGLRKSKVADLPARAPKCERARQLRKVATTKIVTTNLYDAR
jgi:FixJ family two-component response regulator